MTRTIRPATTTPDPAAEAVVDLTVIASLADAARRKYRGQSAVLAAALEVLRGSATLCELIARKAQELERMAPPAAAPATDSRDPFLPVAGDLDAARQADADADSEAAMEELRQAHGVC